RLVMPYVRHRQRNVFRKGARPVHSDAFGIRAKVAASGEAVAAAPANNVPLATDNLAGKEIRNVGADLHDFTHKLVSYHHWNGDGLFRPGVPLVDVKVRPADAGAVYFNEDIINPNFRLGNFFEP